jgi:hypothetical protein
MEQISLSGKLNSNTEKLIFGAAELKLVEVSEVERCLLFLRKPTSALHYEEGFFKSAYGKGFEDAITVIDEALGFECSPGRQNSKTSSVEPDYAFRRIRQLSKIFAKILTCRFKKGLSLEQLSEVLSQYTDSDIDLLVRCAYCLKGSNNGLAAHFLRRALQLKTLKTIVMIRNQRTWDAFHDWMSWFQDTFEESRPVLKIRKCLLEAIDKRTGLTSLTSFETERQFENLKRQFENLIKEALKDFVESVSKDSCFETSELSQALVGSETEVVSTSQALSFKRLKDRIDSTEFTIGLTNLSYKVFSVIQDRLETQGLLEYISRQIAEVIWEAIQERLKDNSHQSCEAKDSVAVMTNFSELVWVLRLNFDEAQALEKPLNDLVDILFKEG